MAYKTLWDLLVCGFI